MSINIHDKDFSLDEATEYLLNVVDEMMKENIAINKMLHLDIEGGEEDI